MNKKSLFFIILVFISSFCFADSCKKPQNWSTPQALKNYELCENKLKPQDTSGFENTPQTKTPCAILADGSYRCKSKPVRFYEKQERAFSLPKKDGAPEGDGAATLAIPPPPAASPLPPQPQN